MCWENAACGRCWLELVLDHLAVSSLVCVVGRDTARVSPASSISVSERAARSGGTWRAGARFRLCRLELALGIDLERSNLRSKAARTDAVSVLVRPRT